MFSITVKLMKKSTRMLIPAGIAILIGTAFIAATFLFGNAMNDSLARQTTAQLGGANYVISVDSSEGLNEQERNGIYTRTVNDFQLDRIRATEGVKDVRVESSSSVTVANGDKHASSYAITTAAQRDLLPVSIIQGDQPVDGNEIALTKSVADQLGVKVGDSVTVNSRTAQAVASTGYGSAGNDTAADSGMTVRVVGITEDPNGAYAYYGGASVLSDNVITAMNGIDDFGKLNVYLVYLDIDDADQPSADATVKQIDKLLPKHFTVQSRAAMEEESIKSVSKGDTSITTIFLLSFGILAMLVAALVIANTFQVLVAQRRRTLALLRTIGANKGQLYVSVLFEAGLLGLIASMLGVGLGIGLMAALCQSGLMKATGMTMRLVLSWPAFVVPIAFGVAMTVIASLGSARSATAVTPLEALRPIELNDTRRAGKIIATGAASAKQTMNEALTTRYSVDMIAVGADMTSKQADEVAKIKGIKDSIYAPTRMMSMKDANGKDLNVLIVGVDGVDALRKVVRADLSGVTISGDSVLMPKYSAATGKDIPLGKSVTFTSDVSGSQTGTADAAASDTENDGGQSDGVQTLTLAPQKVDYRRISANYAAVAFVDAGHFTNGDVKANGHIMLMRIDAESAGTTLNDVFTNVQNAFSASADIDVSGPVAGRTQWETMINGMMALLVGLIAVAVLIALVGVANTLSLSVIERTRESATLRAIGMTRGQLRRSLAVEALLLSLVSGVVGVVLGTLFGWLGSYMVFSLYGDTVFPFEWTTNGAVLGVAALAALLASVAPARRAVKTPPVEALAEA